MGCNIDGMPGSPRGASPPLHGQPQGEAPCDLFAGQDTLHFSPWTPIQVHLSCICDCRGVQDICVAPIMHLELPGGPSGVRGEPHRQLPPRVHGQPQGEAAGDQRYERHQVKSASPPLYSGDRAPAQVCGEEASYEPACNRDELSFCQHPVHATGHRSERASSCSGDASVCVPGPPPAMLTGACRRHSTLLPCQLYSIVTSSSVHRILRLDKGREHLLRTYGAGEVQDAKGSASPLCQRVVRDQALHAGHHQRQADAVHPAVDHRLHHITYRG